MVELIEYILVFGLTVSLSAFSFLILGGSMPVLDQSQAKAQMDEITNAARLAALQGNSTLVLALSDASASCQQGVVSYTGGGSTLSTAVGFPCSFQFQGVSGLCTLDFSRSEGVVNLRVAS